MSEPYDNISATFVSSVTLNDKWTAHIFTITVDNDEERKLLIAALASRNIHPLIGVEKEYAHQDILGSITDKMKPTAEKLVDKLKREAKVQLTDKKAERIRRLISDLAHDIESQL